MGEDAGVGSAPSGAAHTAYARKPSSAPRGPSLDGSKASVRNPSIDAAKPSTDGPQPGSSSGAQPAAPTLNLSESTTKQSVDGRSLDEILSPTGYSTPNPFGVRAGTLDFDDYFVGFSVCVGRMDCETDRVAGWSQGHWEALQMAFLPEDARQHPPQDDCAALLHRRLGNRHHSHLQEGRQSYVTPLTTPLPPVILRSQTAWGKR